MFIVDLVGPTQQQWYNTTNLITHNDVEMLIWYFGFLFFLINCVVCMLPGVLQCVVCQTIKTIWKVFTGCLCLCVRKKKQNNTCNITEEKTDICNDNDNDKTERLITV
jgi:hypothetical protein